MTRSLPARWPQLSALLDEWLDLDEPARAERLARLRGEDPTLAAEFEALLSMQHRVEREDFLEGSALGAVEPTLVGQTIGAYTIVRALGAGGMGSVWLARRSDGRFEGEVAFKLLNLALLGRGGAARFAREGSVLARLTHPNIARLLDAGVSGAGQPYLVLEHVQGEPIDEWCDAQALDTQARVRLLLDVLAAVAHAHSKLVLHRDLKPGNILVTAEGRVKLLDFGIAKLLDDEATAGEPGELTQLAGRAFTPDYAAPEQVEGGEVTTATDVYALGVLMYVLLGGVHPTAKSTDTPAQRLRSVLDTEPPRLSAAAAQEGVQRAVALRGDLDNICAKALKKVPAERYATAEALAADLRRYLAHEPVSARADSWSYRSAKFVRRHRLGVAATATVLLALAAGGAGTVWQALEAQRQRADALLQRDRAQALLGRNEAIADFVGLMFSEAIPDGQAQVIQKMLERSEPLIATEFAGQPAQQAEALRVLASYYTALSLPNKQLELLQRARGIVEQVPDRSLKAQLDCDHASAESALGHNDEALRRLQPWLVATDIDPAVAATCLQVRTRLAQNAVDPAGAMGFAQQGLQRLQAAGDVAPRLQAGLLGDIGFAQHLAGRNAEADRSYQAALDRLGAIGRADGFDALRLSVDRGVVRYAMADYRGGLELFDHALRVSQQQNASVMPPGVVANKAFGLEQLGRYEEALAAYEQAREASKANGFVAGEAYALVGRGSVSVSLGRLDAAQAALDAAKVALAQLTPVHSARTRAGLLQGRIDLARGDPAAAGRRFGAIVEALSAQQARTPALANAMRLRAESALARRDTSAALADAQAALELARTLQGSNAHSDLTGLSQLTLARVLREAGQAPRALEALARARAELSATLGPEHPDTRAAMALQGAD